MFSGGIKSVCWFEYGLVYFRKFERVYKNTLLNTYSYSYIKTDRKILAKNRNKGGTLFQQTKKGNWLGCLLSFLVHFHKRFSLQQQEQNNFQGGSLTVFFIYTKFQCVSEMSLLALEKFVLAVVGLSFLLRKRSHPRNSLLEIYLLFFNYSKKLKQMDSSVSSLSKGSF